MALVLHFNKGTYSLFFCPFTCKVVLWWRLFTCNDMMVDDMINPCDSGYFGKIDGKSRYLKLFISSVQN